MNQIDIEKVVKNLIDTFINAGKISIELRNQGLRKEIKSDNTPVSNGDIEVNTIVTKKIKELTPNIPIVSEETSENKSVSDLKDFWLIDPIDGTYDYINNLEEFTINAGLILNKKPAAGLIYAPLNISIGNIDVTKNLQRLDCGKNISINQNGRTPKFTQ